jgi:hypothetical protein
LAALLSHADEEPRRAGVGPGVRGNQRDRPRASATQVTIDASARRQRRDIAARDARVVETRSGCSAPGDL